MYVSVYLCVCVCCCLLGTVTSSVDTESLHALASDNPTTSVVIISLLCDLGNTSVKNTMLNCQDGKSFGKKTLVENVSLVKI